AAEERSHRTGGGEYGEPESGLSARHVMRALQKRGVQLTAAVPHQGMQAAGDGHVAEGWPAPQIAQRTDDPGGLCLGDGSGDVVRLPPSGLAYGEPDQQ